MSDLKPVYLICGDDDAKIDAWRARVRARAEVEGGPGALEVFEAARHSPEEVAAAAAAMTLDTAPRYLLVDDVEAWKGDASAALERDFDRLPEGTVLVLVARGKAPARLAKAVGRVGEVREYEAPKPWELPKWSVARAQEVGLHLDQQAGKALVAAVGTRPARLLREIERLAVMAHPSSQLNAEQVARMASGETASRAQELADAVVAGDLRAAVGLSEQLMAQEGRPAGLVFPVVRRLRDVHRAGQLLDAGVPEQKVGAAMKMPPWVAKRTVSQAKKANRDALERALCAFSDLELGFRGGSDLDGETALSLTVARATA